jgi:hypothetical protein
MVRKMTFYCGRGLWHPSYEQFYYHLMTTKSRFVAYKFEQKCVEVYRSSAENQSLLRTFNLRAIEVAHRDLRLAVSASAPPAPAPAPAPASASASDESAVRHNKVIGSGQAHGGGGGGIGDGNRGVVIGGVEAINDDHHGDANAPANIGNINHVTNENTHDKDNGNNNNNSSDSSNNNGNQHQVLQPNSDGRVTLQHGSA